jgi:hypothetical protein
VGCWALTAIVCQHLTVARGAEALGVAWNTANDPVLAEGRRVLISDTARFDGVKVIGVDEHVWRHTLKGDKYVTVIIDLTGSATGRGLRGCSTPQSRQRAYRRTVQVPVRRPSRRGLTDGVGVDLTPARHRSGAPACPLPPSLGGRWQGQSLG